MANICTNMFYATVKVEETTERHEKLYEKINDFLEENVNVTHIDGDNCFTEIDFESYWEFPLKEMEKLTTQIQKEYPQEYENLYMRCLSYEFGCEYVSYHIFQNGKWEVKL